MNDKRFNRIKGTDVFVDNLTGEHIRFSNTNRVLKLLNDTSSKSDEIAEELYDCRMNKRIIKEKLQAYFTVLEKHGIHSSDKLDQCLREQRVW